MQEVLPGLFLGPYSSAMKSKLPILQKHGITHIICIRQNIEANFIKPNFQQLFRYLVLDIADNPVENIIRFFPMTKEFIDGSLQNGGKVLVHGNAGISRRYDVSAKIEEECSLSVPVSQVYLLSGLLLLHAVRKLPTPGFLPLNALSCSPLGGCYHASHTHAHRTRSTYSSCLSPPFTRCPL